MIVEQSSIPSIDRRSDRAGVYKEMEKLKRYFC